MVDNDACARLVHAMSTSRSCKRIASTCQTAASAWSLAVSWRDARAPLHAPSQRPRRGCRALVGLPAAWFEACNRQRQHIQLADAAERVRDTPESAGQFSSGFVADMEKRQQFPKPARGNAHAMEGLDITLLEPRQCSFDDLEAPMELLQVLPLATRGKCLRYRHLSDLWSRFVTPTEWPRYWPPS